MSIPNISVKFTATDSQFQSVTSKVESSLKRLGGVMVGLFAADKIKDFAVDSVKTFADADRVWNNLSATLANAGVEFDKVKSHIDATVGAMETATTVSDEDFAGALQTLVRISNDYEASLKNVEVVADLAAGAHIDLNTAAQLVGRAMVGETSTLSRYGIVVKEGADAVEVLRKRMHGLAANEASTLEGRITQLNSAWDNFKEAIGRALAGGNDMQEVVFNLTVKLRGITSWIDENGQSFVNVFSTANSALKLLVGTVQIYATDLATIYMTLLNIKDLGMKGPSLGQIFQIRRDEIGNIVTGTTVGATGAGGSFGDSPAAQRVVAADRAKRRAAAAAANVTQAELDRLATAESAAKKLADAHKKVLAEAEKKLKEAAERAGEQYDRLWAGPGVTTNEKGQTIGASGIGARAQGPRLANDADIIAARAKALGTGLVPSGIPNGTVAVPQGPKLDVPTRLDSLRASGASMADQVKGQVMGVVSQFGPLAAVAIALKPVFDGLRESLAPVLTALAEPLKTVGRLFGAMLAPALKLLQGPLNLLAKAASYVVEGLGMLIYALAKAIDKIIPFGDPLKGLERYGQEMIAGAKAARAGLEDVGKTADKVASSMVNVSQAMNIIALRRAVVGRNYSSLAGTPVGGAGVGGNTFTGDIHLHGVPDPEEFLDQLGRIAQRKGARGGSTRLGAALAVT